MSFHIPFSHLEAALSKWTSYQDDVRQFSSWMDSVEASLSESERQPAELREKTAALGKAKVGAGFQIPGVLLFSDRLLQMPQACRNVITCIRQGSKQKQTIWGLYHNFEWLLKLDFGLCLFY